MKPLKIAAYVVGGVLGLVIVAIALVALLFDPNDYKADIERIVEQRTHRKLTLQGDLKLSVFPWLAVQMGPAQLGERVDAGQFGDQPFVSLQSARLSVKLLPLLSGRVEIGNVQLTSPSIRLITDAQGRHNWDDLAGSSAAPAEPTATSGSVSATIAGIEIQNGEVILDDRQKQERTALHEFALQATGIGSGQPFDLKTSFALERTGATARVATTAGVNADWDNKRYALTRFTTQIDWLRANGPKEGLPITLRAATMAVDLAQQTLQLTGIELNVAGAQLTGTMNGVEIVDAPKFAGHVALKPVALQELLKTMNVRPPATRDAQVLKQLGFESDVAATPTSFELQNIKLQLDDTTARGEFGIADLKAMALRFNLDVDRINFDRYLPPVADAQGQPAAPGDAKTESATTPIPVAMLRALNARGKLRVGEATFSGLKMSKLQIEIAARDGDVQIAPAQASLYGGTFKGEVALNAAGKLPRLALTANTANVDFAPLLQDMLDTKRIAGRGNLNAKLFATGADTQAMLQALNGTLDFKVADGAYEGMDLWYEIRRARAVLKQQATPERTGPARTPFSAIQGTGTVQNGVLSNQDLLVAMQYLKVDGKGAVDLVKSTLDYRFNARVLRMPPEGTAGSEMQDLVDAEIPITAKGPLASPKVRPDIEGYLKARGKEEVKKETEKLKKKLGDKLQDLLRG